MAVAATLSAVLMLGGCAVQREPTSELQSARAAYQKVDDDPEAARSAAEPLDRAERELDQAESLLSSNADLERVNHHAYLAKRYAQIADNQVQQANLQKQIERTQNRRREIKLEMKQRQAERAQNKAEMAQAEAEQAKQEAKEAQRERAELKEQLSELQAEQTERGLVLTLSDVLFAFDKAELKPGGERAARQIADFMQEYPKRRIRVEGYTDSVGADAYNRKLSERRADAVREAIVRNGISASRIVTEGYGESYPVADNGTSSGRQQNRRVEIVISDQEGELQAR